MSVFNSLGTNYSPKMAWRSLLPATPKAPQLLKAKLKAKYGASDIILTNRGREAIVVILKSLDLPVDSYVAITGYTCYVVYEAVLASGLKPYFVDINKDNLNFTVDSLGDALKKQPDIKAVIIQNTLGIPVDILPIEQLCKQQGVALVEDLAHCAGAIYSDGREVGTVGVASALSFSQNKMIDAVAGGAAIFMSENVRALKLHFKAVPLSQRITNYLYPLTTQVIRKTHQFYVGKVLLRLTKAMHLLPDPAAGYAGDLHKLHPHQAKLALNYIDSLTRTIKHRRAMAEIYQKELPQSLQFQGSKGATYIRFPVVVDDKKSLEKHLSRARVLLGTSWYETVIAPERFLPKALLYRPGSCPNGEWMARHIINLPTHININADTANRIAKEVNQCLKSL